MEHAQGTEKVTQIPTPAAAGAPPAPEEASWGTKQMGPPAAPSAHPQNQQAAYWGPHRSEYEQQPYVLQHVPVPPPQQQQRPSQSPMENILDAFDSWTRKAETLASNVWHNSNFFNFLGIIS